MAKRKVICVETGKIYESCEDAAYFVGHKTGTNIRNCCYGYSKSSGGYHWEYYNEED